MSLKSKFQKQYCVYWAPGNTESGGVAHDRYGNRLFAAPVEKACRWEDIAEQFKTPVGIQEVSKSVVFVDGVEVGGVLMLGLLTDITDAVDPQNNAGAWVIKQKEKIPNKQATVFYEWAYL